MTDRPIELQLELPAGALAPSYARALVSQLEERLPSELVDDVVLLVSEIVTNSVRHAELAPDDVIRLRVRATSSSVRLDVADLGRGFDRPDVARHDPAGQDGWGLVIVDRVAHRWGVAREGGSRVWFEIDAGPQGRRSARVTHEWSAGGAAAG